MSWTIFNCENGLLNMNMLLEVDAFEYAIGSVMRGSLWDRTIKWLLCYYP